MRGDGGIWMSCGEIEGDARAKVRHGAAWGVRPDLDVRERKEKRWEMAASYITTPELACLISSQWRVV